MFRSSGKLRVSPTGSIPLQTIAASAVGERLTAMAVAGPDPTPQVLAGPQVEDLGTMSRAWRRSSGRSCLPLPVWLPGKTGRALRDGALTDASAAVPGPTFAEWLAGRSG